MSDADTDPVVEWVRRLQWRHPREARAWREPELLETIRTALATCPELEIVEEADVLRYLALRVLLTPEQRRSPLLQGVLVRILGNLDWDAEKRLDFVYKHVVGRPVSPEEPDLGPGFAPRT
jgi:hypothetical protein